MKTLKFFLALVLAFVTVQAFAIDRTEDDEVTRLRAKVEAAVANDWQVYADAASQCIDMRTNLSEAYVWIEKSIAIKATARNMEVKADYLLLNGAKDMAIAAYQEAIRLSMEEGNDFVALQKKMLNANRR